MEVTTHRPTQRRRTTHDAIANDAALTITYNSIRHVIDETLSTPPGQADATMLADFRMASP